MNSAGVKLGYSWGVVGQKFSHRPGNPATVGVVRWPAAGDTAGSSLRRLSSLQHRIYNLLGSASRRQRPSAVSRLKAGRAWSELAGRRRCSAASAATQQSTLRALSLSPLSARSVQDAGTRWFPAAIPSSLRKKHPTAIGEKVFN